MKFLLDANLPRSASAVIVAAGHEAVDWRDVGDGSAPDEQVAQHAKDNQMCVVTRDFDFSDVRNYPPAEFHGIVVLDLPDKAVSKQVCDLLASFVARTDIATVMPGRLAIVRLDRVRFRPRLPG